MLSKNKIKYIQTLYQKKHREKAQLFVAEGDKIIQTILQHSPSIIDTIFATQAWANSQKNLSKSIKIEIITTIELQQISALQTPNEVLCLVKMQNSVPATNPLLQWVLVLDDIQDPGNLGTIIRLAHWFGIKEIICSLNTVDCYNSKVVQSTMGSFTQVNICYTDVTLYLQQHKKAKIFATILQGEDVKKIDKNINSGIIVVGNEGKGLSNNILQYCNSQITIKGKGNADSLNAAMATGIILSHLIQ